jgi:hypothetical protein
MAKAPLCESGYVGSIPTDHPNVESSGYCLDFVNPEHAVRIRVSAPMDQMNELAEFIRL